MNPTLADSCRGLLVVDLSRQYPGPFAAQLLADLGARVIKVEEPGSGDLARLADPQLDGTGHVFAATNRGKESVAVSVKKPEGAEVVRRLAARADVLLEGFRPGVLAAFGLAPETLLRANPKLVVASLTGFGQTGPLRAAAGHDLTYQALAGVVGMQDPPRAPATQTGDVAGALSAVVAILAQLRTGRGAHLDLALADAALSANAIFAARTRAGEPARPGVAELAGGWAGYDVYRTADGKWLALAALEPKFWERFLAAAEARELESFGAATADPALAAAVAKVIGSRTLAEWARRLDAADVPWAPVLAVEEALAHPQFISRGHDGRPGGALGLPPRGEVPRVGEHTDAVLAELGYARADVERLRAAGVVESVSSR